MNTMQESCPEHNLLLASRCINCHAKFCKNCHHFLINGRSWCALCGQDKVPKTNEMTGHLIFLAKSLGMLTTALIAFWFFPGFMLKLAAAVLVTAGWLWFGFFNGNEVSTRIEEFKQGQMVKSYDPN